MNTANSFYEQMVQETQRAKASPLPVADSPPKVTTTNFFAAAFLDRAVVLPSKPRKKLANHTAEV